MTNCKSCGKDLTKRQKYFCSRTCSLTNIEWKAIRSKKKDDLDPNIRAKCKVDGRLFKDYKNYSGNLTKHLSSIGIQTSDVLSYYDIIEHKQDSKPTWKCPYCSWTTVDYNNKKGGWITSHINKHGINIEDHIQNYPEDSDKWLYSPNSPIKDTILSRDQNSYIECLECNDKFKRLTISHLNNMHGMTLEDYRVKHNITNLSSHNTREILSESYFENYDKINAKVKKSKIEEEVCNILTDLGITVVTSSNNIIPPKELDIYLPDYNLAIEINGLYWHSEYAGKKHKTYHLNKTLECESKGIQLLHIFDDEWNNKKDIIIKKLLSKIKKDNNVIYARKCIIKEIDSKQKSYFLKQYHIQGDDRANIKLGLFYDDILVSVMTFGGLRRSLGQMHIDGTYELVRYATSSTVIGGASKLLSHFINNYSPNKIISYADRRFTTITKPSLYDRLGFTLVNMTKPNYWYTKDYSNKLHRYNFNKGRLVKEFHADKNKSETRIMFELGYDRVWDCGNIKYELTIN